MSDVAILKSLLGVHIGFPKEGITFLDIFPLLRDPLAFESLITHFLSHIFTVTLPRLAAERPESVKVGAGLKGGFAKIDVVVGLDARGFLLGPVLAQRLGAAFVPVRKQGKLPGKVEVAEYEKEYGVDKFEIQSNSILPSQTVLIIDDLIATGGSAKAAGELVEKCGGLVVEYLFVVGLGFLKGHEKLNAPTYSMIDAED